MDQIYHKVNDVDKLFYYFFSEEESCNLILRFVLRCRISKPILKKALNKTLERFPNFRQTPVVDEKGDLYTRDNDQEAEIYAYDPESVNLGTGETNGYLFRVMAEGNTMWISVFHGICDGRGYMMFARTLLYHYLTYGGCCPCRNIGEAVLTEGISGDPSEMSDPLDMDFQVRPGANPFKPTGKERIFTLPNSNKEPDKCNQYGLYRFILDTEKLVALAKQAETTVDTYIHQLIARTIHEGFAVGEDLIVGMGAVDLRPYYNSRYLQNLRELFWIYYSESFFSLSEKDAAEFIRRQFKDPQLCKENFDRVLAQTKADLPGMLQFPITFEKGLRIMRERAWEAPELGVTYFTTNLGRFDFDPEIDAFVEHADMYGPAIFQCPVIFFMSHGNETSVCLSQRHFDRCFPLWLRYAFEKKGLLVSAEMGSWFENDKVKIETLISR